MSYNTRLLFEQFDRIGTDDDVGPVGGSLRSAEVTTEDVVFDPVEYGFGAVIRITGSDAIIRTVDPDDGMGRERVPHARLERVPKTHMPTYLHSGQVREAHR